MKKTLLLGGICFLRTLVCAQGDPVLMRINEKEILRSEFEYAYQRHVEDLEVKPSISEYTELFILHKLKVEAAKAAGMDTTSMFHNLQEEYLTKLRRSYLMSAQALDSCSRILYQKRKSIPKNEKVQVMQIFKYLSQATTASHLQKEENRMDSLYRVIESQPDINFTQLVEIYSDDKNAQWITALQTTSEFESVVFSLMKGEISKPFSTPEGLHILKVVDRKELSAYEDISGELIGKLNFQMLNSGIEVMIERLKKKYGYLSNLAGVEDLLSRGETEKNLFTLNGQEYTGEMFKLFASSHPLSLKRQLNEFIIKSLLDYEIENLEDNHPEIRRAMQEHGEDYLAMEVERQRVDLPSVNDRAGVATYFKFHQSDYRWKNPRYRGIVLHCIDKKTAKQAKKLLKKVPEKEWADTLRKIFNTPAEERIKVEQGLFADGDNKFVDRLIFKRGNIAPLVSYPFTVLVGEKQKGPNDYREVIEQVRKDYKNYLGVHWKRDLQALSKVEINEEVLKTVNNN